MNGSFFFFFYQDQSSKYFGGSPRGKFKENFKSTVNLKALGARRRRCLFICSKLLSSLTKLYLDHSWLSQLLS